MTVSPTRPSGRSGWGLSCFVLGYLGSSILILPLAPRRGAWSSYFPTPKPPGPNPPGTPPIQDPGGPRKPASPLKNKEGGAEPWNPGLGRRPSGGGEAQDTPPAVLSQFLATPPASLASPPPPPARVWDTSSPPPSPDAVAVEMAVARKRLEAQTPRHTPYAGDRHPGPH